MILRRNLAWRQTLAAIARPLGAVGALSLGLSYATYAHELPDLTVPAIPLAIFGVTLGIFLVLRNCLAYNRWWEARQQWSGILNGSRSMVRQAKVFAEANLSTRAELSAFHRDVAMLQIAFLHATRLHLRRQDVYDELRRLVPEQADALFRFRNVPNAILLHLGDRLRDAFHHGLLGESRLVAMEETMGELTRCLGGCERIKNTPMLRQYDDVPRIGVYLLSFMLPFGLNHALGWLTAPVAVLVAFLFLALDELGRAVEDPFENSINDVPLTALCASVEIDLRQMVGDANLPEPVTAVDGLLY